MDDVTRPRPVSSEAARPADTQAGRALLHQDRPTATVGGPETRVSDRERLVKLAADGLTILRGCVLTDTVARLLGEVLALDFPWVPRRELFSLVAPAIAMGCVIDDAMIDDRARQIAQVALLLVRR